MNPIYCVRCKKQIAETDEFCRFCGSSQKPQEAGEAVTAPLPIEPSAVTPELKIKRRLRLNRVIIGIAGACCFATLIFAGFARARIKRGVESTLPSAPVRAAAIESVPAQETSSGESVTEETAPEELPRPDQLKDPFVFEHGQGLATQSAEDLRLWAQCHPGWPSSATYAAGSRGEQAAEELVLSRRIIRVPVMTYVRVDREEPGNQGSVVRVTLLGLPHSSGEDELPNVTKGQQGLMYKSSLYRQFPNSNSPTPAFSDHPGMGEMMRNAISAPGG